MRLKTVQNYVNNLFNRGEINEEQKNLMRPKATQIGRPYGLPKTHKPFQHLPKFQSITDTMNTLSKHRKALNIITKSVSTK